MKCIVINLHMKMFSLTHNWLQQLVCMWTHIIHMCGFCVKMWTCEQGEAQLKQDEYWEWSLQTFNYGRGARDRHFILTTINKIN